MSPRYPVLSYLELSSWIDRFGPSLQGARIERVFVPACSSHPDLYFKKEWVFELYGSGRGQGLYLSLRPQACGIMPVPERFYKASSEASRSGFDLSLHKHLTGGKIRSVRMLKNERVVIIEISSSDTFELHLHLIAAKPMGALLQKTSDGLQLLSTTTGQETYELPLPRDLTSEQLAKIPNRNELTASVEHYRELWQNAREATALAQRRARLEGQIKSQASSITQKIKSLQEQLTKSKAEPDWNYYGSLLQTHFYSKPVATLGFFTLMDYERNEEVQIPADPKLDLKKQLERYFHQAKRNKKRLEETAERILSLEEKEKQLQGLEQKLKLAKTHEDFLALEPKRDMTPSKSNKKLAEFSGKQIQSKEGLTILTGRNLTENLELTFKIARGNDLWFHVKGRPGAHVVVILPPKKSASLETLLDAAHLAIIHSGGKDWGKTEVDYTFRKFVKKIKNQTEVSYTNNKTLMVTPEPERLKRLYASE